MIQFSGKDMAIDIQLDFRSGLPITNQIVEQVQRLITAGKLRPGDQLPTVRALASDLRVNFNTVARAYRILDEAGIISTQQGRGTYILDLPPPGSPQSLQRDALIAMTDHFISDVLRMGISKEELTTTFDNRIKHWQESENLP
jgi:GntR family transcriptional regulator